MASKERRKSDGKAGSGLVTVHVPPAKLRAIFGDAKLHLSVPAKTAAVPSSPAHGLRDDDASESIPATPAPATPIGETATAAEGTPVPLGSLAPPAAAATGSKKKGVKRSSAVAGLDGAAAGTASGPGSAADDSATPRARTKPGPKKRAKLDDPNESGRGVGGNGGGATGGGAGGTHKLGPKASMGAINAGLRALDRSGKPCRRWAKGGFRLKSFTGVAWEVPRWKAPTPAAAAGDADEDASATVTATASASASQSVSASASAAGSNKENDTKDKADKTNGAKAINAGGGGGKGAKPENAANTRPAAAITNGHAETSSDGDVDMTNVSSAQPSPPAASTTEPTEAPTPVAIAA